MECLVGKRAVGVLIVAFWIVSCSTPPTTDSPVLATQTFGDSFKTETPLSITFTSTDVPIQTMPSTLSPTQISEIVRGLYNDNGECDLPCLWGVVPGKTSIKDVYDEFSQIGYFEDQTRPIDHFQMIAFATVISPINPVGPYNNDTWGFGMRVEKKSETVAGLNIRAANIKEFFTPSLSKFLTHFGKPDEIRVRVIESMLVDETPDYEIALYYPTKGVFIRWRGETESVVAQTEKDITVMICPQHTPTEADIQKGSFPPHFYLFSPNENMPFDEIIKKHLSEDPSGSYQPLDTANIEKFYTMYLAPSNQGCFPFSYSFSP